jgi:hypothetical protein
MARQDREMLTSVMEGGRAKTPLAIVIADAEIKVPHALAVQGRHRPLDAQQRRRAPALLFRGRV